MTVLSESSYYRYPGGPNGFNIMILVLGIFLLIYAIIGVILSQCEPPEVIVYVIALAVGIILIVSGLTDRKNPTEYKVILTDDYPAKELLSKYEVLDIDGDIYILKDRDKPDAESEEKEANG